MNTFVYLHNNFRQHPFEDFAMISDNEHLFSVADGVTQDKYDFPDTSDAAQAAKLLCQTFDAFCDRIRLDSDSDNFSKVFDKINQSIKQLNDGRLHDKTINYKDIDLCGAVGVFAAICESQHLHYGFVGDCGIIVERDDGDRKLITTDDVSKMTEGINRHHFTSREHRKVFVRSKLRNKPGSTEPACPGYGVFTGEDGVRQYYQFGKLSLARGDRIWLFSDGLRPLLEHQDVAQLLRSYHTRRDRDRLTQELTELCNTLAQGNPGMYGDDKALIIAIV